MEVRDVACVCLFTTSWCTKGNRCLFRASGRSFVAGDEFHPIEAVTWDFSESDAVTVKLVVGDRPYTF